PDQEAIFAGSRVVAVTAEQNLIHRGANLVRGSFYEPKAQIPRWVRDSIEIAGQLALRRKHHDRAGVRELARTGIVRVAKSDRIRKLLDLRLITGEEVPAVFGAGSAIQTGVNFLFHIGEHGFVFRIDPHRNHIEILADFERQLLHAAHQPIQHLGAKHGTLVVNQRQDDGLASKELAERYG